MAKNKGPVVRIEGAGQQAAAQGKPRESQETTAATPKASAAPKVEVAPAVKEMPATITATVDTPQPQVEKATPARTTAASPAAQPPHEASRPKASSAPKVQVVGAQSRPAAQVPTAQSRPAAQASAAQPTAASVGGARRVEKPTAAAAATEVPAAAEASPAPAPKGFLGWLTSTIMGHAYAVVGALCGLTIALLVFFIGFWKTLFICVLVFVGVTLGQYLDGDPKILNVIRKLIEEVRGDN